MRDSVTPDAFYRQTELDRTRWPELRDQILRFEHEEPLGQPRTYPGYPRWPLEPGGSLWAKALRQRRSPAQLEVALPPCRALSRILRLSHGIQAERFRGPVPSAGGLQALELYLVNWVAGWLPDGLYHYDRAGHFLAQLAAGAEREPWEAIVPSLPLVAGGALLWVLVGDSARVEAKYGARGLRFLVLEAGHLMQNLCLLSTAVGMATAPLGGFFEPDVARAFHLPATDLVLYVGVAGLRAKEAR